MSNSAWGEEEVSRGLRVMRDDTTKAGTRFATVTLREDSALSSVGLGSSPIYCPISMYVNLGKLFPSLNFRAPCILSGNQHDNAYLIGVRINEVRKTLTSMPGMQKAHSSDL